MTGPGHVWIIPGWFSDEWYLEEDTTCSPTEMTEAASGYISMETQVVDASAKVTESGRVRFGQMVPKIVLKINNHFLKLRI